MLIKEIILNDRSTKLDKNMTSREVEQLVLLCAKSNDVDIQQQALKTLLNKAHYQQLQTINRELAERLYNLIKSDSPTKSEPNQQTYRKVTFQGSPNFVYLAMREYERASSLTTANSQVESTISLAEVQARCWQTITALLCLKIAKAKYIEMSTPFSQLELSAAFKWLMTDFKIGLRQLNRILYSYIAFFDSWHLYSHTDTTVSKSVQNNVGLIAGDCEESFYNFYE